MTRRRLLLAAALAVPLAACGALSLRAQQEPSVAQPALPTQDLTIVGTNGTRHVFHVEVATTEQQQETGLMFRRSVPAAGGMIFVWPRTIISRMWMKNTLVPLDMVFVSADGRIDSIAENTVPESLREIDSAGEVKATIELQGGITQKLGIEVGDRVTSPLLGGP